jgi:hypothetical protein
MRECAYISVPVPAIPNPHVHVCLLACVSVLSVCVRVYVAYSVHERVWQVLPGAAPVRPLRRRQQLLPVRLPDKLPKRHLPPHGVCMYPCVCVYMFVCASVCVTCPMCCPCCAHCVVASHLHHRAFLDVRHPSHDAALYDHDWYTFAPPSRVWFQVPYAAVMTIVYPVGVPLFFLVLLYKHRYHAPSTHMCIGSRGMPTHAESPPKRVPRRRRAHRDTPLVCTCVRICVYDYACVCTHWQGGDQSAGGG